jgi:hypothetical protein
MKRTWTRLLTTALLVMLLAIAGHALAQGGGYTLMRAVSQSNGVIATQNRDYQLVAVVGQPIAGSATAQNTQLGAGYWYRSERTGPTNPSSRKLFLPIIRR